MPIYGYACEACGHTLDALQKMSDAPLTECPECGETELRRQLSAPRFRLKGQGWYETDFKRDKQRNLAGDADASKAEPAGEGKGEAKQAEAKPDTGKDAAAAGDKNGGKASDKAAKKRKREAKAGKGTSGDKAGSA